MVNECPARQLPAQINKTFYQSCGRMFDTYHDKVAGQSCKYMYVHNCIYYINMCIITRENALHPLSAMSSRQTSTYVHKL